MTNEATHNPTPSPLVRRLATILCADVAGYSQLMGANEERTVRVFRGHREIFESLVNVHRGRIFNTAGDALLAEFDSAVEAVRCATEIQAALASRNAPLPDDAKMLFRIGINLGDVIVQGDDLLGDGVNVAARIQTSTEPAGICISGSVYDQVRNKLSLDFRSLGEQSYKNIAMPVRTYTINEGGVVTAPKSRMPSKMPMLAAAAAVVLAGGGFWGYQQYDAQRAERAHVESQLASQLAAQQQATAQAQRAAEDAKRDAQLQAQKQAADEALHRAQDERNRLEQDRKLLETEKRIAADAAKKQAEVLQRAAPAAATITPATPAMPSAPSVASASKAIAKYDGTYAGRLCNQHLSKEPGCWPVVLVIRDGVAEGTWISSASKKTSRASGSIVANGKFELKVAAWTNKGDPNEAVLAGSVANDRITATGQWRIGGGAIAGDWKRAQVAAAAPSASNAPKGVASYNGTYTGRLCTQFLNKEPGCWTVVLVVRDGVVEGNYVNNPTKKTAQASGTVVANGAFELKLASWTSKGDPNEAVLVGSVANDRITASGRWRTGGAIEGSWKRAPL